MRSHTIINARRRSRRFELSQPLMLFNDDHESTSFGLIINLSSEGMLVATKEQIVQEKTLSLLLEIPQTHLSRQMIHLRCVVKWSVRNDEGQQTHLGCCFTEVDSGDLGRALAYSRARAS